MTPEQKKSKPKSSPTLLSKAGNEILTNRYGLFRTFTSLNHASFAPVINFHAGCHYDRRLAQHLLGQCHVIERPVTAWRVSENRLPKAGALGQLYVAANVCFED